MKRLERSSTRPHVSWSDICNSRLDLRRSSENLSDAPRAVAIVSVRRTPESGDYGSFTLEITIRLLSTLALKAAVEHLAGRYEAMSGTRMDADFAPTLGLVVRLRGGGECADPVMLQ